LKAVLSQVSKRDLEHADSVLLAAEGERVVARANIEADAILFAGGFGDPWVAGNILSVGPDGVAVFFDSDGGELLGTGAPSRGISLLRCRRKYRARAGPQTINIFLN
jgi:hypothetical protein